MKYILIALLVLIGGIVWSNSLYKGKAEIETVRNIPLETSGEEAPLIDDTANTPEENDVIIKESALQTDIGMEYPETDMSQGNTSANAQTKIFEVSGVNFAFDITEITVQEGDTVTINFISTDGFHDLVIDEFDAHTEKVRTGGTTSVTFIANKKGRFEYYCSVGSHRVAGMMGTLIVE